MGSSGIRAGASGSAVTTQTGIEYLDPLWAGRGLEETVAPTIAALNDLPREAGFPADCARVGGGFSAMDCVRTSKSRSGAKSLLLTRTTLWLRVSPPSDDDACLSTTCSPTIAVISSLAIFGSPLR